jgi:hypothetical protein
MTITPNERRAYALFTLRNLNIAIGEDFHVLSSTQVDGLLAAADQTKYRKPKDANGSRARYFHALLQRRAKPDAPKRERKTIDVWRIWVNYGQGWEHECSELTWKEAREQVACYRANCNYPVKVTLGRDYILETN